MIERKVDIGLVSGEEERLNDQFIPKMPTSMGTSPSLLMMGPRPGARVLPLPGKKTRPGGS